MRRKTIWIINEILSLVSVKTIFFFFFATEIHFHLKHAIISLKCTGTLHINPRWKKKKNCRHEMNNCILYCGNKNFTFLPVIKISWQNVKVNWKTKKILNRKKSTNLKINDKNINFSRLYSFRKISLSLYISNDFNLFF